jgi:hypothetical protein
MAFPITADDYQEACDGSGGICLACGEFTLGGVEPDAEGYHCEFCGESRVEGIENALIAGRIEIIQS